MPRTKQRTTRVRTEGHPPEPWGHLIANARDAKGLTQEELAEEVGISRVSINRIENGRQTPRLDVMERIARALGVKDMTKLFPYPRLDR